MSLQGTNTEANLQRAFAIESQANRRYLYFAQKADIEGYPEAATLFKNIADRETGHAFGHLEYLASMNSGDPVNGLEIGDTQDNFTSALYSESHDSVEVYPAFAQAARDENLHEIAEWFDSVARAKTSQAARFQEGLDALS